MSVRAFLKKGFLVLVAKVLACQGWKDGSVVKNTEYSARGAEFNSQQPQGSSQPSVMGSDALF